MIDWPKDHEGKAGWRMPYLFAGIDFIKPKTICEIGCYTGKTSVAMCNRALKHVDKLHFFGYDLFDLATEHTDKDEINGKGHGNYTRANKVLTKIKKACDPTRPKFLIHDNKFFDFELHKGYTVDTLKKNKFDFVFLDGGHSYDTVKHDYEMVKDSKLIIFDDYDLDPVQDFCNEIGATSLFDYKGKHKKGLSFILNI